MIVHFINIDRLSVKIIQNQPARHRQLVLTRLCLPLFFLLGSLTFFEFFLALTLEVQLFKLHPKISIRMMVEMMAVLILEPRNFVTFPKSYFYFRG